MLSLKKKKKQTRVNNTSRIIEKDEGQMGLHRLCKWGLDKGVGLQSALGSSDWCKQRERTSIVRVLFQKLLEQMLVSDYMQ